jgi:hypothetical protein
MARAQPLLADIPLIEEQVETGLKALLDAYRSPHNPAGDKKDDLLKRFTLLPSKPLPEFDNQFAKAYAATDDFNTSRTIYAMVCENNLPYRHTAINAMLGVATPHVVSLLGAGTVNCSHLNESRYVLFIEKPQGVRLSEAMRTQPRLHEHKIIDYVLWPVVRGLLALREKKISHGNLFPGSIFIGGENAQLGDCYSMPCGTMAHYLYEPVERLMCDPLGHGEANEKSDVYAMGVLAYELMYGLDRMKSIAKEDYIKLAINISPYQIFASGRDLSDKFQDFFRGVLNDSPSDRWSLDQVVQWLGGKHFNMIAPAPPKEAARPFAFGGEQFLNRRLLAHAFQRNWREAVKDIKTMKLERWCETSLHRPEMGEKVERALRIAGEASTEKHVSDMMTRIIAILDPIGPLRSMSLSVRPDALGLMIADCLTSNNQAELGQLLNMVETDVSNYWSEGAEANKSAEMSASIFKLQRMRPYLKSRAFGFGIERVLYDLNPSMPCQSDLLRSYHITTAAEALKALDSMAHHLAPDSGFMDRHLAAFVASRLDITKEIRLEDLVTIPKLAHNEELIVMKILARVQQKNEKLELVGLCTWAAMRIEKMIDEIHNRVFRKRLKLQLKKLASTGNLNDVLGIIVNRDVATRDYEGFAQAIALHQINWKKIERFENPNLIDYRAREMGGKMATMVSYMVLTVTSYIVVSNMLGF